MLLSVVSSDPSQEEDIDKITGPEELELPSLTTTEPDKNETVSSYVGRETLMLSQLRPREIDHHSKPDSDQLSPVKTKKKLQKSPKVHTISLILAA
jgi:hypothetical protein